LYRLLNAAVKKQKQLREFIEQTNAEEGAEVLRRDYEREKVYDDTVNKAKNRLSD
jgi:hypothetical protein